MIIHASGIPARFLVLVILKTSSFLIRCLWDCVVHMKQRYTPHCILYWDLTPYLFHYLMCSLYFFVCLIKYSSFDCVYPFPVIAFSACDQSVLDIDSLDWLCVKQTSEKVTVTSLVLFLLILFRCNWLWQVPTTSTKITSFSGDLILVMTHVQLFKDQHLSNETGPAFNSVWLGTANQNCVR